MALAAQKQVRQLYVGLDFPEHANVGALKAGTNGDLALLSQDGSAIGAGKKFTLLKKSNNGGLLTSDIVDPSKVKFARSVAYQAPVLGEATISGITANANTLYTVEVVISQFGSLSAENEYVKKAFYKAKTGDNAENIVDGLVKSLSRNFKREEPVTNDTFAYTDAASVVTNEASNVYFTFAKTGTGASAALVITEKTDWADASFNANKMTRQQLDFTVGASFSTLPTIVQTGGTPGVGTGKQVAEMEFFLKGERNDFLRGAGYPHNFEGKYDANVTGSYNAIEIGYYEEGRDEAKKSNKGITIYLPFTNLAGNSVANGLIADLNTILGSGTVAALATS